MAYRTNTRLVPLETLYPDRPPKEKPKKKVPFIKPGKSASIPNEPTSVHAIRYVQTNDIRKNLMSLEKPLQDIENDTTFIANAMNSALQVPKAIESTFNRIHGRIYDIQREIEYSSNSLDDKALIIQSNFRKHYKKEHYQTILNALHRTINRDCAPIHETLLSFILLYEKKDDHLRLLMNRRFLVRNRYALRYWREWADESNKAELKRIAKIPELHENWLRRSVLKFIRKWKDVSFSKHSRKAIKELQQRITTEAQRRLSERPPDPAGRSILELLAIERESVIIDFGTQNHESHLKKLFFLFWRRFIEQCKSESRSGNQIARAFWITRKKRSFFTAWFSLSVGRVNVFGGYARWNRPINARKESYAEDMKLVRNVVREWGLLCTRRRNMIEFLRRHEKGFMRQCLVEYHKAAAARRARLAAMVETYRAILRARMHRVFTGWHRTVIRQKVRKLPSDFLLKRSVLMRRFRMERTYFRKWSVSWTQHMAERNVEELEKINGYVEHWESAGREMRESMLLIKALNEKLTGELGKRRTDLVKSKHAAEFMRLEQESLALAMRNAKDEIERLHELIGKSSMRYFVDVKPVHENVVEDVPGALQQYIEQKEEERQRIAAEKLAQQQVAAQKQRRDPQTTKRRKTTFAGSGFQGKATPTSRSIKSRKSVDSSASIQDSI